MSRSSPCCECIPIRNGVIVLGVLTVLGGIGDAVVGFIMMNLFYCADSYTSYYGHYDDNYYYYGGHDYNTVVESTYCHGSLVAVGLTSIILGTISFFSGLCLLVGVKLMMPSLLVCFLIFVCINAVAYLTMGIIVAVGVMYDFPQIYSIWPISWSLVLFYFLNVVHCYRAQMIHQLTTRAIPNAAYPVIPAFQTGVPVGMQPTTSTIHLGQPGSGIITQLQPGIYAQPGNFVYPANYFHGGMYAQPQPGAYPQLGAYPQPGIFGQPTSAAPPGTHGQPGISPSRVDVPPPYTLPLPGAKPLHSQHQSFP